MTISSFFDFVCLIILSYQFDKFFYFASPPNSPIKMGFFSSNRIIRFMRLQGMRGELSCNIEVNTSRQQKN